MVHNPGNLGNPGSAGRSAIIVGTYPRYNGGFDPQSSVTGSGFPARPLTRSRLAAYYF